MKLYFCAYNDILFLIGHCFQKTATTVQSGSLESEAGIYASTFDQSGSRLITCEADKSIKVWKEDGK